ncbi:integrase core domain-containing protein [Streptomyces sp. NPDC056697]|uniref:integrase core domain-containing protein n=1 Tax=Streptomyces sp. NPDC056697 TaxID=3345915 RepID=UPI00367DF764
MHSPHPRPGREIHGRFRRRVRQRGHHCDQDPSTQPNCNPHAERFIRSAREECTDRVLLFGRGHAEKILHDYAHHFNSHRPRQGRDQLAPSDNPNVIPLPAARIKRRQAVASLINEYHRAI